MSDPHATVPPMQSEQTRQWRRERKRLEREEKRRSLRDSLPVEVVPRRRAKMSATLLDYAGPLIKRLPDDIGLEKLKMVLQLAAVVWNAVVEEDVDVDTAVLNLVADMKSKLLVMPPEAVIEWLAHRRVSQFGDDPRVFLSVDVVREGDRMRVLAAGAAVWGRGGVRRS